MFSDCSCLVSVAASASVSLPSLCAVEMADASLMISSVESAGLAMPRFWASCFATESETLTPRPSR